MGRLKKYAKINKCIVFIFLVFVMCLILNMCGFCYKNCNINAYAQNGIIDLEYNGVHYSLDFNGYIKSSDNFIIQSHNQKWGRDGNRENIIFTINKIIDMGLGYEKAFEFVFKSINNDINNIIKKIDIEPENSKIIFTPNFSSKFQITQEKVGHKVDKEELYSSIFNQYLLNGQCHIKIFTHKVYPTKTKAENLKATQKLSTFNTDISKSSSERKHNVRKALSAFNGLKIEPNEIVSFNKVTGKRTESRGYKKAHIILNEMFVDGVGGGVCQSSTTLYNALILSDNVKILQSSRHSMPVGYVQLGFDAMVSYGTSDLVFQNISEHPIFLHTYSKDDKVYVEIYGQKENNFTKKRRTEIIKTFDAKPDKTILDINGEYIDKVKYKGQKYRLKNAQKGYEVQTYLDYYEGDNLIKSTPIRHCIYPAQEGIIVEGIIEKCDEEFDN